MKRILIKALAILISIIIAVPCIGSFASTKNDAFDVEIKVKERNGIAVKDFFFRRGIAIEKGKLYDGDEICIKENGNVITSAAEVSDRYDDGSIRWLLVSGKVDLRPGELKTLSVTNGKSRESTTNYQITSKNIFVSSPKIEMTMGENGIESLKYNGVEKLGDIPINLYVTTGEKTDYLVVSEMSVLKATKSYSKFKLKGRLNSKIHGEMYITLAENASEIEVEHRINMRDTLYLNSVGLTVGSTYQKAASGTVIDKDFLDAGNMQLATYDNTRFNEATNVSAATGFVIGEDKIDFAPIINGKDFKVDDGITRTAHLSIGFLNSAEDAAKTLALPPSVKVDSEQYVRAGLIKTSTTGALFDKIIESVKYSYEKTNGRFNVGALAATPNKKTGTVGSFSSVAGEIEYNLGMGWMQCQDEEVFRHMEDCSEMRSDIGIYRGLNPECFGVMRTRPVMGESASYSSHLYYSDEGGLYMTYLLTGNEWVYESYKLAIEKNLKDMFSNYSLSQHMPVYWFWGGNLGDNPRAVPYKANYSEVRGLIRVRTLYLASELFKNSRYKEAAFEMIKWAEKAQRPDGSFSQAVYNDGRKYFQGSQPQEPIKDYILLYGFRGVSELLEWTDDERILGLTCRVADYLCSQCETFGPLLMNPNSNKEVYAVNETGARGSSAMTNAMAVDVLCTAFEKTKNERYLRVMLEFLEAYLCNEIEGLGPSGQMEKGNSNENRAGYGEIARCSTLLRASDNITEILRENREMVEKMGFENILLVFSPKAKRGTEAEVIKYSFPAVVNNVYELGEDKAIFAVNNFAQTNDGDWEKTVQLRINENRLWEGVKNIVSDASSVILEKYLVQYDQITAMQRPVFVEELEGTAEIFINEYSKDKISVELEGDFETEIRIADGKFAIKEGKSYDINVERNDTKVVLTVTEGGNVQPLNGRISVKFNSRGKLIEAVGSKILASVGLSVNDAYSPLSQGQLKSIVKKVFNQDIRLPEKTTWNEFADEIVGAMAIDNSSILENAGLKLISEISEKENVSDEEAVTYAADALNILYEGEKLSSDVFLADKSIYQTNVSWSSDRPDILSPEGVLNRYAVDCDTVTLTAKVSRNNAVTERSFVIPVIQMLPPEIKSGPDFAPINETELKPQSGIAEIQFTVIPKFNNFDGIISFNSSKVTVNKNADTPYLVRFNTSGYLDCINSDWYYCDSMVYYKANTPYHFRMIINTEEELYDCYVQPEGEKEVLLCKDYSPRQKAPRIDMIDRMWTWAAQFDKYDVTDISIIDYVKTEPAGDTLYNEFGLMFGKYGTIKKGILPMLSENGNLINWKKVNTSINQLGGELTVNLAQESKAIKELTLIELLKKIRLLEETISESDAVTPASITRILLAVQNAK